MDFLAIAARDVMLETGWKPEYIEMRSIDWVALMYFGIQQRELNRMGIGVGESTAVATREVDERWKTKQWEERIGPDRVRVHSRVNVADLFDSPQLLTNALSGKS